jgi:hypothetical protein
MKFQLNDEEEFFLAHTNFNKKSPSL